MSQIDIVTLNPSDWQQFKKIRLKALKENPEAFGSTYQQNLEKTDSEWKDRLGDPKFILLFAKQNNTIVGIAGVVPMKNNTLAHILWVYVEEKMRGQGISKLLMKELIIRMKKMHIKDVELHVNPIQKAAIKLYEGFGLRKVGTKRLLLGDGKEHDCYQMEMKLDLG